MAQSSRISPYTVFLHVALVGLAALTIILFQDNRRMLEALNPEVPQLATGTQVEQVQVTNLEGTPDVLTWDDTTADRLLFVFTTTCPACQQNQAAWRALHEALNDDLEVVGISLSDPQATAEYREANDLPFEVVLPADRIAFTDAFEVKVVPFTFHIDGTGRVQGVWRGGLDDDQLNEVKAGARPARG